MSYLERQQFARPLVHLIDAEADSVGHFRQWSRRPARYFLVRADDRLVENAGQERRCSAIREELREQAAFQPAREILHHGKRAYQWVAEIPVRLLRAAQRNRPKAGDRRRVAGPPLDLRLIVSEARDAYGRVLAVGYLLTNVPAEVAAATIALWYYWRWSIESYFKLLKSAGMQVEAWQQETAAAIARRLLVASMACVTVWRLGAQQPSAGRSGSSPAGSAQRSPNETRALVHRAGPIGRTLGVTGNAGSLERIHPARPPHTDRRSPRALATPTALKQAHL